VLRIVAEIGIVVAVLLLLVATQARKSRFGSLARQERRCPFEQEQNHQGPSFRLRFAILLIDSAARMEFLTFLSILLQAKGATIAQIGLGLTLVFAAAAPPESWCAVIWALRLASSQPWR
jgi:hypothetical protein